jgi:hypothetical protein
MQLQGISRGEGKEPAGDWYHRLVVEKARIPESEAAVAVEVESILGEEEVGCQRRCVHEQQSGRRRQVGPKERHVRINHRASKPGSWKLFRARTIV